MPGIRVPLPVIIDLDMAGEITNWATVSLTGTLATAFWSIRSIRKGSYGRNAGIAVDEIKGQKPVAFIVPKGGQHLSEDDIKQFAMTKRTCVSTPALCVVCRQTAVIVDQQD
jgi:hypothetical protein